MAAVGDVVDTINLIKGIIDAIETAHKLKDVCLEFKEYLWCISKNLEQLQGMPLSDTTVETLRKVDNVLVKAHYVINSSQNHNCVYLMFNGARIEKQIKEAHSVVVGYMGLIPIMQFFETLRLFLERKNIILRELHESTSNGTDAVSNPGCLTAQRNDAAPLRIFAIKELSATDDFKHDRLIGTGAFGSVYKGLVKDNRRPGTLVVAIKRFHRNFDGQPSKEVFRDDSSPGGRTSASTATSSGPGGKRSAPQMPTRQIQEAHVAPSRLLGIHSPPFTGQAETAAGF